MHVRVLEGEYQGQMLVPMRRIGLYFFFQGESLVGKRIFAKASKHFQVVISSPSYIMCVLACNFLGTCLDISGSIGAAEK